MCEDKREVAHMGFLEWMYTFSQVQCLLYGKMTRVLDSQIHSGNHLVGKLRRERKYQGKWTKNMGLNTAAEIEQLHQDLNPILEKEYEGTRWMDRLPSIIQTVEKAVNGNIPKTDEFKPFFRDMLHYINRRECELQRQSPFV